MFIDPVVLIHRLIGVQSALDDGLGDTDVTHIESDRELREQYPVQWAAGEVAQIVKALQRNLNRRGKA